MLVDCTDREIRELARELDESSRILRAVADELAERDATVKLQIAKVQRYAEHIYSWSLKAEAAFKAEMQRLAKQSAEQAHAKTTKRKGRS